MGSVTDRKPRAAVVPSSVSRIKGKAAGSAQAFAERCDKMSGGRIKIQVFAAGELLPAFEGFDAVSNGTVELNHGVSYFWSGKTFAAQYFATVPFGMSFMGHYAWLQFGGGMENTSATTLGESALRPRDVDAAAP